MVLSERAPAGVCRAGGYALDLAHTVRFFGVSHTGRGAAVQDCLVDAQGHVYLTSALGVGLVHTLDVPLVAEAVEAGRWLPQEVLAEELPDRYGIVMSPQGQWGARETPGSPRMVDTKQS